MAFITSKGIFFLPCYPTPPPTFRSLRCWYRGGHTQLMQVNGLGSYRLLGETVDDAAGEAFDKTAKLLGLAYPGGPALSKLADEFSRSGSPERFELPRPMLHSGDLNFSFSGLKTAVLTLTKKNELTPLTQGAIASAFQRAVIDVLSEKALAALEKTGLTRLVVAGGVGANRHLRDTLRRKAGEIGATVFYPELQFCTDNGAMIAFAGAMRMQSIDIAKQKPSNEFTVKARWELEMQETPSAI